MAGSRIIFPVSRPLVAVAKLWGQSLVLNAEPRRWEMPRTCQGYPRRQVNGTEWSQPKRVATRVPDGRAGGIGPSKSSGNKMVLTGAPDH